ncbi:hypothetical protein CMUS01_04020 [Colletotrichum musicola]|uniref:Uncharacterized protein n=1 Tax=Colletotrichum musicola TaxID=2175873 RepID=A0A8H6U2P4_9PEZI|nr:hypothetical protein CMUS01_04020 [Colletotrichum musicola]
MDDQRSNMSPRYLPSSLVGGHAAMAAYLSVGVARGLYRSYRGLPPSQGTRARMARRSNLVPVFASLAFASLCLACYWTFNYMKLSYRVWADVRGVEAPVRVYGSNGVFPYGSEDATRVHVARWMTDTPVHLDALEIIAEKARRLWWGQQVELAMISWSLFLAVEGRRRHITSTWAYLALAHLVGLSFAQNLFYLAMLLGPSVTYAEDRDRQNSLVGRLRNKMFPPKPVGWNPHASLFLASFCFTYVLIYWAPSTVGTATFVNIAILGRVLTFAPIIFPAVVPVSWGTVNSDHREAPGIVTELFRFLSTASFVFHVKGTVLGLLYNAPDSHYHRHSRGVSQGIWAATRALDVNDILASTPLARKRVPKAQPPTRLLEDNERSTPESGTASHDSAASTRRKTGVAKEKREGMTISETGTPTVSGRVRRARARKATTEPEEGPEATYEPSIAESRAAVEGDELPDGDLEWESAALAWGLTAVGGLGSSSAGIFGADCTEYSAQDMAGFQTLASETA